MERGRSVDEVVQKIQPRQLKRLSHVQMQQHLIRLQALLSQYEQKIELMEKSQYYKELDYYEQEAEERQKTIEALEEEKADLNEKLTQEMAKRENDENELNEAQEHLSETLQNLLRLREDYEKAVKQWKKKEDDIRSLEKMYNDIILERKKTLEEKDQQIKGLLQEFERERSSKQSLQQETKKMEGEIQALEYDNHDMKKTLEETEKKVEMLQEEKVTLHDTVEQLEERINVIQQEKDNQTKKIEQKDRRIAELKQTLQKTSDQVAKWEQQAETFRNEEAGQIETNHTFMDRQHMLVDEESGDGDSDDLIEDEAQLQDWFLQNVNHCIKGSEQPQMKIKPSYGTLKKEKGEKTTPFNFLELQQLVKHGDLPTDDDESHNKCDHHR